MDCSKTENYFKEKNRMTNTCNISCTECPLSNINNSFNLFCHDFERKCSKEVIEIVQKWSDEHPTKTILDDFLEKFPHVVLNSDGIPESICCRYFGYKLSFKGCTTSGDAVSCINCWNHPFNGFVKKD